MREIAEAHKFFVRTSQHYILGNWSEYEPLFKRDFGSTKLKFNRKKWEYLKGFPRAYVRFMYFTLKDLLAN